jgi:ribonuclease P protein component
MAPDPGVTPKTGSFGRDDRVRRRPEFQAVYKACAPIFTASLVFYARPGMGRRRLGCTVPRSVGGAVVRNRVKRLLREGFRRTRPRFPEGCTLVVNAKRSAGSLDFQGVLRAFEGVAERLAREGFPPCAR